MFDLLAAGYPGSNDYDFITGCSDGGREAAVANGKRKIVVLLFETERAGHAAAARIDFADFEACRSQNGNGRHRSNQSPLMAMTVEQRFASVAAKI
jgi:hypothetical protein